MQIVAGLVLVSAVGWRTRRWRLLWLPRRGLAGVAAGVADDHWNIAANGLAGDPAPRQLWVWIGADRAGRRGRRRGLARRALVAARHVGAGGTAVPLCSALMLNLWVGYFPTVQTAWNQLTAGPLPDQTDRATVTADGGPARHAGQGHAWCR